jgi:hypothetical protein
MLVMPTMTSRYSAIHTCGHHTYRTITPQTKQRGLLGQAVGEGGFGECRLVTYPHKRFKTILKIQVCVMHGYSVINLSTPCVGLQ